MVRVNRLLSGLVLDRHLPLPFRLNLDCPEIFQRRTRGGDDRAYAHVGHYVDDFDLICLASDAADLGDEHALGLILHEVGHVGALAWGYPDAEKSANDWVRDVLGITITYRGHPPVQWVDPARLGD